MEGTIITVIQWRQQFSTKLDRVSTGTRFLVSRHGVPCVRLRPARTVQDLAGSVPIGGPLVLVDEVNEAVVESRLERVTIKASGPLFASQNDIDSAIILETR